ncbi:hypothetical protein F4778DRAFT_237821 [Xylariomycetidae sp. FL2044]|nr:hypothetical protein F4778DRAFT_237821 [Xylariomycetidae sp. FL2044]
MHKAHLLSLPRELRDIIYSDLDFARPRYRPLEIRARRSQPLPTAQHGIQRPPPLAHVCQRLRSEVFSVWYGENDFEVTLDDEIVLDSFYLLQTLKAMGDGIGYVRRLVIAHKIDRFLSPVSGKSTYQVDAETIWVKTVFQVRDNGGSVNVETSLRQAEGSCACPLSQRLRPVDNLPAGLWDCPLSRSVFAFLRLVDTEKFEFDDRTPPWTLWSQDKELERIRQRTSGTLNRVELALRMTTTVGHYPLDRLVSPGGWPECASCGRRQWMLQGPRTGASPAMVERETQDLCRCCWGARNHAFSPGK